MATAPGVPRARGSAWLPGALVSIGFGTELWSRYLPVYLRTLGAGPAAIGLFGSLEDLLDAAYAYPGGALSDRLGYRRALLLFGCLSAAGAAGYALAPAVPFVFAALFLAAAWSSLGLPATFAAVAEESASGFRVRRFTTQAIVKRLPVLVAPPLGGLLLQRFGVLSGVRVGLALSVAISAATLLLLGRGLPPRRAAVPPPCEPRRAGSRGPLHPALQRLLVADCLVRLCEGLPSVFLVLWALEVVRVTPAQFGLLQSVLTIAAIASYAPAAALRERALPKPFVVATFACFTLFPLAVLGARSFPGLVVAYVVGGLRELGEPSRKALLVELAAAKARGRTVGAYYTIRGFAVAGAAGVGGLLWSVRPALTFLVAAALGAAGTIWCALFLPSRPMPLSEAAAA